MSPVLELALLLCLGLAAWTDVRTLRIPNWLTLSGILVGLGFRLLPGAPSLADGLLGFGVGLAFGVVCFACGLLGGGDAKLLAAVGALIGFPEIIGALVLTTFAGAVIALAQAWRMGRFASLLQGVGNVLVVPGRSTAGGVPDSVLPPLPYGVAIALGTTLWHFALRPLGGL